MQVWRDETTCLFAEADGLDGAAVGELGSFPLSNGRSVVVRRWRVIYAFYKAQVKILLSLL